MKRASLLLILNVILNSRSSLAQEKFDLNLSPRWTDAENNAPDINKPTTREKPNWYARVAWGLFGAFTAYEVHEFLGHYVFARAMGYDDIDFTLTSVTYRTQYEAGTAEEDKEMANMRLFAISGFISQGVTAQFLLSMDFIPKDSPFVIGYIAWTIVEPIVYVARTELGIGNDHNDILVYEQAGGNKRLLEAILVTQSAWFTLGLLTHRDFWGTYISPKANGAVVGVVKRF